MFAKKKYLEKIRGFFSRLFRTAAFLSEGGSRTDVCALVFQSSSKATQFRQNSGIIVGAAQAFELD
ncbi:MAG: hypothetical protein CMI18_09575 [Opitutaceae bacterium]|nr:hypothetical protein [Opitutaceae bacterium]